jgi:hypothetical protein
VKKTFLYSFLLLFVSLSSFGIFYLVRQSKLSELDYLLENTSLKLASNVSLSLAGQVKNLQDRLISGRESVVFLQREARYNTIASQIALLPSRPKDPQSLDPLVGFFRSLFQLDTDHYSVDQEISLELTRAYFWERNRKFNKALTEYESIQNEQVLPELLNEIIKLHQAYCYLELANYTAARDLSNRLMLSDREEIRQTASMILQLLWNIERAITEYDSLNSPPLDQALHLLNTLQYQRAIELLEELINQSDINSKDDPLQIRYLYARSLEENGQADLAFSEYRKLIHLDPKGPWGVESARRSYMMTTFYDYPLEFSQATEAILQETEDPVLEIRPLEDYFSETAYLPEDFLLDFRQIASEAIEIFFTSRPRGAAVFLEDRKLGNTPLYVNNLSEGEYTFRATYGLEEDTRIVELEEGLAKEIDFDLSPRSAYLQLNTNISIEKLYINQENLPLNEERFWKDLTPGEYTLVLSGVDDKGVKNFFEKRVVLRLGYNTVSIP